VDRSSLAWCLYSGILDKRVWRGLRSVIGSCLSEKGLRALTFLACTAGKTKSVMMAVLLFLIVRPGLMRNLVFWTYKSSFLALFSTMDICRTFQGRVQQLCN